MPTIWGLLDRMHHDDDGHQWIEVKTALSSGIAIHVRAVIEPRTIVARGVERVPPSSLRSGESVEVTYHHGYAGFLEAEMVYVLPDQVAVSQEAEG